MFEFPWEDGMHTQALGQDPQAAQNSAEAVAIIGMAARAPGAAGVSELWQVLCDSRNTITEVPAARFNVEDFYDPSPATPGRMMSRFGGFLDRIEEFDAEFFGISPREAECMDPQQRLLMEVAWEAFEDAGLSLRAASTLDAAVLMGVITSDYWDRQSHLLDDLDVHTVGGSTRGGNAGRISYALNLRGLSVAVDAACSSSLVGVHLATRALRAGDCEVALAGGVNMILNPDHAIGFSQGLMMAPDGQCKAFDARADGYVRSEGAAVVVLKLLSRAIEDGDRIHAVIRGSAASNDGHGESFMAPQTDGQSAGLRAAYRDSGVDPASVGYIEAHGTGTSVGDPVEIAALQEVLGSSRPAGRPLVVGSVKTNIGHCEGAAGAMGLIKAALCVKHGFIPESLNFRTPSTAIPWDDINVRVATAGREWQEEHGPRRAGVSSFGITGTNVHVVLEEPPLAEPAQQPASGPFLLPVSARSEQALRDFARRYGELLAAGELATADIAYSASMRRTHHGQRLAVVASSAREAAERLEAYARGEFTEGLYTGDAEDDLERPHATAWIFPGQGGQWLGMGRDLLLTEKVFAEKIAACESAFAPHVQWSLTAQLTASPEHSLLARIDVAQPVIFAVQVALAALWLDRGLAPDVVVGHSMGEAAAAHVAGILSLEDAALLICRRSLALRAISGKGVMAAVDISLREAREAVAGHPGVSLAVNNGPASCVLSGEEEAVAGILRELTEQGRTGRMVKVDIASHSPQVEPLRPAILDALTPLRPGTGHIPMHSTVTGQPVEGTQLNAAYWMDNLREPVLFGEAIQQLAGEGIDTFVEFGPHPVLLQAVQQNLQHCDLSGPAVPAMVRGGDGCQALLNALAELYTQGRPVPFEQLTEPGARLVSLPAYPWQRERHWREELGLANPRRTGTLIPTAPISPHPLLGTYLALAPGGSYLWDLELDLGRLRYLTEHRVHDVPVLPGAAYHELALASGKQIHDSTPFHVEHLRLDRALFLSATDAARLQIRCAADGPDRYSWSCYTHDGDWIQLATATLVTDSRQAAPAVTLPDPELFPEQIDIADHYAASRARGIVQSGPFQALTSLRRAPGRILAGITVPHTLPAGGDAYLLHPALLDCALQPLMSLLTGDGVQHDTYLPVGTARFFGTATPAPGSDLWCVVTRTSPENDIDLVRGDFVIGDSSGRHLLSIEDFCLKRLGGDMPELFEQRARQLLHDLTWNPVEPAPRGEGTILVLGDGAGVQAELLAQGIPAALVPDIRLDAVGKLDWHGLLDGLGSDLRHPRTVVYVHAGDDPQAVLPALALVQALAETTAPPRLWMLTSAAHAVHDHDQVVPSHSALWGLGRVVRYEVPDLRCSLADLPDRPTPRDLTALCAALAGNRAEDEIAVRDGIQYASRLTRGTLPERDPAATLRSDATYLIVGGLGGVGLLTAQWMARNGARHLVLVGRSSPTDETGVQLAELTAQGAQVRVEQADVSDLHRMTEVFDSIAATMPPLRGVVHSAVVLDDAVLTQLTPERFLAVMPAKVHGARNLHRLTRDMELDFFVLNSSAASLIGSPGQGNYAVANAYLDGLAHHRRALGLPALSVNWGQWAQTGQVAKATHDLRLAERGFKGFAPADGLAVLGRLLHHPTTQVGVMAFDPAVWARDFPAVRTGSLLHDLDTTPKDSAPAVELGNLLTEDETSAHTTITAYLCAQIATVVKLPVERVQGGLRLNRLGIDSLMAVQLRNRITEDLGTTLPIAVFMQRRTVGQVAELVLTALRAAAEETV
ncbi:SDR family NAD(P)-dependent oxidoreductase [Streptomyces sp. SYSU K21746]